MRLSRSFATTVVVLAAGLFVSTASRAADGAGVEENVYRTTMPTAAPAVGPTGFDTWEAYDWDKPVAQRQVTTWPADEPVGLFMMLKILVPALLILGCAFLVITFAYRSARAQMRRDRVHYQLRGRISPSREFHGQPGEFHKPEIDEVARPEQLPLVAHR